MTSDYTPTWKNVCSQYAQAAVNVSTSTAIQSLFTLEVDQNDPESLLEFQQSVQEAVVM